VSITCALAIIVLPSVLYRVTVRSKSESRMKTRAVAHRAKLCLSRRTSHREEHGWCWGPLAEFPCAGQRNTVLFKKSFTRRLATHVDEPAHIDSANWRSGPSVNCASWSSQLDL